MIISLYTEKAFDKIQPLFMVNILKILGGPQFVKISEAVGGFGKKWFLWDGSSIKQEEAHFVISHSFKDFTTFRRWLEGLIVLD